MRLERNCSVLSRVECYDQHLKTRPWCFVRREPCIAKSAVVGSRQPHPVSAVLKVVSCVHSRHGNLIQCPQFLQFLVVFTQGRQTHPVSAFLQLLAVFNLGRQPHTVSAVLAVAGCVHPGTATSPSVLRPCSCWLCSVWDGNLTQCPPSLQLLVVFTQGRQPHPVSSVLAVVGCVQSGTATSHSVRRPCSCWLCSPRDGNLTLCLPSIHVLVVFTQGRQPLPMSALITFVGCVQDADSPSVRSSCGCVHSRDSDLIKCQPALQFLVVFTQGRQPHPVSAFLIVIGLFHSGFPTSPCVRRPYICLLCSSWTTNSASVWSSYSYWLC